TIFPSGCTATADTWPFVPAPPALKVGSMSPSAALERFTKTKKTAKAKASAAIAAGLPNPANEQRVLFRTSDFIRGEGLRITGDWPSAFQRRFGPPPIYPGRRCVETSDDESAL